MRQYLVTIWLDKKDLKTSYTTSRQEAQSWREDYPSYERLADNDLMPGLDENLPEVNDGSLAAALFKLPKRIVSSKLSGRAKAVDRDEAWLTELANLQWENEIVPNANSQAPFIRKWKDAVRKAAIYGSVPIINLFVTRGDYTGSDFIVVQPQDVTLEAGKVSDYDSDRIYWDVYYTKTQLENMIEQAEEDKKLSEGEDGYDKWDIPALKAILKSGTEDTRQSQDTPRQLNDKNVKNSGIKFCVVFQRGVKAPFYMYHENTDKVVREWENPDPTGDVPVHFLYCYQDMINPYGIGIVKLAGGTQNALDYLRQADILATQLGIRPPSDINGDTSETDFESMVYAQDAQWITGNAKVTRMEMANGVYGQLAGRIQMYKTSLNQIIPTGDTSATAADTGDPTQSRTPAGVKLQEANLSIDDEDFKDNLYITYRAVAKSMINVQFANMQGKDLMKLNDDERDLLTKAGMQFPENEDGEISNELEVVWDTVRASFDFEVSPENDKTADDAEKLKGLQEVAALVSNPATMQLLQGGQPIMLGTKELNPGELFAEIISLVSDNDKILTDVTPEDMAQHQATQQGIDPATGQPLQPMQAEQPLEQPVPQSMPQELPPSPDDEMQQNIDAVMQEYGVDEQTAITMLAAEASGLNPDDVIAYIQGQQQPQGAVL